MTIQNHRRLTAGLLGILALGTVQAADWTQFRGPNHDGATPEKILKSWPAGGLRQIWKVPVTDGFSSFAVGDGKAFTLEARMVDSARQEVCVAFDANNGKELWAVPLGIAKYENGGDNGAPDNKGGDGPRSTPAFDGGRVYTLSARLVLQCLDASNGKMIWLKDLIKEHQGRNITWEDAASPMIDGNLIFVAGGGPGQSLLAFDKTDGHVVWKGQDERMTHSTPVAATIMGVRQVIFFTQKGLVSLAAKTGAELWRYPFRHSTSTAMSPIVFGDVVFCSAGYNVGSGACRITKSANGFEATQLWFTAGNELANHWSTPVCKDGYLYGLFGFKKFANCPMKCVRITTGEEIWSKPGFGPGGCTLVDGHVLVLTDSGSLVLVKATPAAYTEVARSRAIAGKCWSTPCVSNGRIFARSTKEGACLDVSTEMVKR